MRKLYHVPVTSSNFFPHEQGQLKPNISLKKDQIQ